MRLIVTQTNQSKNVRKSKKCNKFNCGMRKANKVKNKIIKYIDVSHGPLCADEDKILFISPNGYL